MTQEVDLGVEGLTCAPGDHICGVYRGVVERDRIVLPCLEAGLLAGHKCVCIVDVEDPTEILAALSDRVDARLLADNKQLDVVRASDVDLRSAGSYSVPEILSVWKATISDAMYSGRFDLVQTVKCLERNYVQPNPSALLMLESEVNRFLPLFPQVVLCLYDLDRFDASIVVDLVKTHPKILLENMVCDNPYFMTPDELLAAVAAGDGSLDIPDGMRELANRVAS
jgi:MEDS: MEthanogen/methylotroph, DcmR Sensory domain